MNKICLVCGSMRGKESTSLAFLEGLKGKLNARGFTTGLIAVRAGGKGYDDGALQALAEADAVVLAFPLYAYSLPGALMKLLEDYGELIASAPGHIRQNVYAIVNCGFHDPEITAEAIRVVRNFCRRAGLCWRFAVAVGGGVVMKMTSAIPLVNLGLMHAYSRIAGDIASPSPTATGDILLRPIIPKFVMMKMKDSKWAKRFMTKKKTLFLIYQASSPDFFSATASAAASLARRSETLASQ